jgi:hypothetical protein
METPLIELDQDRFRLAIPLSLAIDFALGYSDLDYIEPEDALRHVVGLLAVDTLQYTEQWRPAAMLRMCLAHRWPDAGF